MSDQRSLEHLLTAVVELGDRLHTVMSHADAARTATPPDADAPPPGLVLLGLLADVAQPKLRFVSGRDLRRAAHILDCVRSGIEEDLFLIPLDLPPGTTLN